MGDSPAIKAAPTPTRHLLKHSPQCACLANSLEDATKWPGVETTPPPIEGPTGKQRCRRERLAQGHPQNDRAAPQASLPSAGGLACVPDACRGVLVSPVPALCTHRASCVLGSVWGRQAKGRSENVLAARAHTGLPKIHSLPSRLGFLIEQERSSMGGKQCQVQGQQNPAGHSPSGGRFFTRVSSNAPKIVSLCKEFNILQNTR